MLVYLGGIREGRVDRELGGRLHVRADLVADALEASVVGQLLGVQPGGEDLHRIAVPLTTWAGTSVRIVIVATDGGHDSEVEIGIDDVRVERPT